MKQLSCRTGILPRHQPVTGCRRTSADPGVNFPSPTPFLLCNILCNNFGMSEFLKRFRRKPTQPRSYVSYDDYMKLPDNVRPITLRLPVSTVAKLDELQRQCPTVWSSRQELLFEMIESCVKDWIDSQPKANDAAAAFDEVARKALRQVADE